MIVKQSEWKELKNAPLKLEKQIELLKSQHKEEIRELNLQIEKLKDSKKPDEIVIDIYGQTNDNGFWTKYKEVQFTRSTINLSNGVKWQVLRIFRKVLHQLNDYFDKVTKNQEVEYYKIIEKYYLNKNKVLKMPYFVTRKRVLKELFNEK